MSVLRLCSRACALAVVVCAGASLVGCLSDESNPNARPNVSARDSGARDSAPNDTPDAQPTSDAGGPDGQAKILGGGTGPGAGVATSPSFKIISKTGGGPGDGVPSTSTSYRLFSGVTANKN